MNRLILTTISTLLLLGACGVRPPIEGRMDPYQPKQVHFASSSLKHETAVGEPTVARDENGLVYITVPIRSETSKELYVDYRVTFFDANRQVLHQTSWFTKVLSPKVPDQIMVNSTSSRADDFQIDFRWAR
ncbi:MAG: DUF1425 domain-containing protein [Nitrospira sp.]|nr:DUF1425 domain-containing protein [Nitrospira sp.]